MNYNHVYKTLAEVQAHKNELREEIHKANTKISNLWDGLLTPKKANTKGELVTSIISNSITAFDAFLLVHKLMNKYSTLFGRKRRKK